MRWESSLATRIDFCCPCVDLGKLRNSFIHGRLGAFCAGISRQIKSFLIVTGTACCISGCAQLATSTAALTDPLIIPVEDWGGTRSELSAQKPHRLNHITLHHGGVSFTRAQDPKAYLRNLQGWSRSTRKWSDAPYHYLIDLDGKIYEARDLRVPGDTNTNYDPTGHALIMVMGNYEEVEPNHAQLEAVVQMMTMLAKAHRIPPDKIGGHLDYTSQTVCPGKNLIPYLRNGYFQREVSTRLAGTLRTTSP